MLAVPCQPSADHCVEILLSLSGPAQYVNTIIAKRRLMVVVVVEFEIFTPSCWLLAILKSVDPQDNLLALNSQIRVDSSRHLLWSFGKFK